MSLPLRLPPRNKRFHAELLSGRRNIPPAFFCGAQAAGSYPKRVSARWSGLTSTRWLASGHPQVRWGHRVQPYGCGHYQLNLENTVGHRAHRGKQGGHRILPRIARWFNLHLAGGSRVYWTLERFKFFRSHFCHCEERSDEAIQPFRQAQGPESVEGLDRHGALRAPRDDKGGGCGYTSI